MDFGRYAVISPVRNEGQRLGQTIESMVNQTIPPGLWIIVDDGSTDDTPRLIDQAVAQYPWIRAVHRPDRGFRQSGAGVIEAFYDGYELVRSHPWDLLGKLDGDLEFGPRYFEDCIARFHTDPKLGIGGGRVYSQLNGAFTDDSPSDPRFHVRGATKIYRRATWEAIGGLLCLPGWDSMDELKANMLGWRTYSFPELNVRQLKGTGSADGTWRNWFKNGRANYVSGYHPLFMFSKCLRRLFVKPYALGAAGLFCGFISGYLNQVPQVKDDQLIQYVRRQQMRRLWMQESIWR